MKTKTIATYLMRFPETSEDQPFGPEVDVYKVAGKVFAILSPEGEPPSISLKCDPVVALGLRDEYAAVTPGYHLNKTHWNTVALDDTVPDRELKKMISHSFEQVVAGLPKTLRVRISRANWPTV
ncbi:MAG: MmcQ/YjbR family DNA-binding protein [Acidimicrobiales bacterium]